MFFIRIIPLLVTVSSSQIIFVWPYNHIYRKKTRITLWGVAVQNRPDRQKSAAKPCLNAWFCALPSGSRAVSRSTFLKCTELRISLKKNLLPTKDKKSTTHAGTKNDGVVWYFLGCARSFWNKMWIQFWVKPVFECYGKDLFLLIALNY